MSLQTEKCIVTDENGRDFEGKKTEHGIWVLVDEENGFGWPVGVVQFSTNLKLLPNGKYGA